MGEDNSTKTFTEGMAALEAIVEQLESGDLPLESALSAFESGVALVRELNQRLTDAELRVEVLTRAPDGNGEIAPLDRGRGPKE